MNTPTRAPSTPPPPVNHLRLVTPDDPPVETPEVEARDPRETLLNRLDLPQDARPFFPCTSAKTPAVASWADPAQCSATPLPGWYGMACGPRSGAWALDLDVRPDKDGVNELAAYCAANNVVLPETCAVRTPSGGRHLLFNWPEEGVRQRTGFLPGCDTRTDGGYVIAAGSPGYTVDHDGPIADAPEWLLELVRGGGRPPSGPPSDLRTVSRDDPHWQTLLNEAEHYAATEPPCIDGEGGCHTRLLNFTRHVRQVFGLPRQEARRILDLFNSRCVPPWSEAELEHKLDQTSAYYGQPGLSWGWAGYLEPGCLWWPLRSPANGAKNDPRNAAGNDVDAGTNGDDPTFERIRESANSEPRKTSFERGDHAELAEELIRTYGAKLVTAEGAIWAYDVKRGVWEREDVEKNLRKTIVSEFAGMRVGEKGTVRINHSDVEGTIKIVRLLTADPTFFTLAPVGVACSNGFVHLNGVQPHSPDNRARTFFPLAFDPDATSALWDKFLDDLFRDDADKAEKIAFLQEFFGGALFGLSTRFQQCIVAVGGGSNGKSTLFKIIRALFPAGTTQAIPPSKWDHAFTLSNLVGVLLNMVGDMPESSIIESENFKSMVHGDPINAEIKLGACFQLIPVAAQAFACNTLPPTTDHSAGFWRSFIVVPFNRNFEDDPTRDMTIGDKIVATERAAVLAWLVAGARRLAPRGTKYLPPPSHAIALKTWQRDADTVATFKNEHLKVLTPEERKAACSRTPVDQSILDSAADLYLRYSDWAKEGNYKPVARNKFGLRMAALGCPSERTVKNNCYYPVSCSFVARERPRVAQER